MTPYEYRALKEKDANHRIEVISADDEKGFKAQGVSVVEYCHRKLNSLATEKWQLEYFRANDYPEF